MKVLLWLMVISATDALGGRWEYLKVYRTAKVLSIENLNKLGDECWELVACPVEGKEMGRSIYLDEATFTPYAYSVSHYCIFKRPSPRVDELCP